MCSLERIQGYCLDMQRWDQERQEQKEFNLMRDVKNKKAFYSFIDLRKKAKESVPPLTN